MTQQLRRTLFQYDSAELSWTWRVSQRMSSSFLFWGSDWYSSTETFCSNLVLKLQACLCLFYFFLPLSFLLLPLSLSSLLPCHNIFCLTCCLTAGMLAALSLYHSFSLLPLSLKTGKKSLHFSFCSVQFIFFCFCFFLFLFLNVHC